MGLSSVFQLHVVHTQDLREGDENHQLKRDIKFRPEPSICMLLICLGRDGFKTLIIHH